MIIQAIATKTIAPFLTTILDQQRREQLTINRPAVRTAKGLAMYDNHHLVGGLLMQQIDKQVKITALAVLDDYRHQKIGSQLLQVAETWARRRGISTSTLSTRSYQALGFYQQSGYQLYGQLTDVPLVGITTYYLYKRLGTVNMIN